MKVSILAAAMVLASSIFAFADAQFCADKTDPAEMSKCSLDTYAKEDGELKAVLKQIEGRLKDDADGTKLLTTAQKSWTQFRDDECAFSSSNMADSTYTFIFNLCRYNKTVSRKIDLKAYLKCGDGDMDCPVPAK